MVVKKNILEYRIRKSTSQTIDELKPVGLHVPIFCEGMIFDVPVLAEYKYKNENLEEYIALEYVCTIHNQRFAMNKTSDNLEHEKNYEKKTISQKNREFEQQISWGRNGKTEWSHSLGIHYVKIHSLHERIISYVENQEREQIKKYERRYTGKISKYKELKSEKDSVELYRMLMQLSIELNNTLHRFQTDSLKQSEMYIKEEKELEKEKIGIELANAIDNLLLYDRMIRVANETFDEDCSKRESINLSYFFIHLGNYFKTTMNSAQKIQENIVLNEKAIHIAQLFKGLAELGTLLDSSEDLCDKNIQKMSFENLQIHLVDILKESKKIDEYKITGFDRKEGTLIETEYFKNATVREKTNTQTRLKNAKISIEKEIEKIKKKGKEDMTHSSIKKKDIFAQCSSIDITALLKKQNPNLF